MKKRDSFTNRLGFILACVGSAVGMGNLWMFPTRVSLYGGGSFLIPYFIFVVLIGATGVIGEMAFGRAARSGPVNAFGMALESRGKRKLGEALGLIPMVGALAMAIGYTVVMGWILKYAVGTFTGATLAPADVDSYAAAFGGMASAFGNNGWQIAALLLCILIMMMGIGQGIEKANKIMMPLFFLLFVGLAVYIALQPGAVAGYRYIFRVDPVALKSPMTWIYALGQAFFSLSVTGSGMIVYGAYLSKDEDVVGVAQHTALFDTIAAVVAALVIIPACFSYGLDVGAGPSLLFVTLPTILQDIPMGRLFAIILYLAMIFAGVSSLQNMFEAVAESLLHKFSKLSRTAVLAILCVLCLGIGIFMEPISKWGPWMDLVSIYIIPIGATLGAISWFYVMKKDELLTAVNTGSKKERGALWYNVGRFVYVPLAVILCCVALFMHVAF